MQAKWRRCRLSAVTWVFWLPSLGRVVAEDCADSTLRHIKITRTIPRSIAIAIATDPINSPIQVLSFAMHLPVIHPTANPKMHIYNQPQLNASFFFFVFLLLTLPLRWSCSSTHHAENPYNSHFWALMNLQASAAELVVQTASFSAMMILGSSSSCAKWMKPVVQSISD